MNLWTVGIWVVGLGIHSLVHFLAIVWLWSKRYTVNDDKDSNMAKILYGDKISYDRPTFPLKRVALFCTIPIVGTLIFIVYWFIALMEEHIAMPNPIHFIAKLMFRKRYLLDRVAKEI